MHHATVNVTGICHLVRIILVGIIVDLCDLVSAVEYRNTGLHKHIRMQHQVLADRQIHRGRILLKAGLFDSTHGRSCTAEAGISGHRISIVQLAAARAVSCIALEIVIQVLLMGALHHALLLQCRVIQSPADIIVATQVIQKYIILWQAVHDIQLLL